MSTTREKDQQEALRRLDAQKPPHVYMHVRSFADGCAHRDRQVVAFLRVSANALRAVSKDAALALDQAADAIERGEHVK